VFVLDLLEGDALLLEVANGARGHGFDQFPTTMSFAKILTSAPVALQVNCSDAYKIARQNRLHWPPQPFVFVLGMPMC
jgi:hypothetical protein